MSGEFRVVDKSSRSKWYANRAELREAFTAGDIEPESLLYDSGEDRWCFATDHESVAGLSAGIHKARGTDQAAPAVSSGGPQGTAASPLDSVQSPSNLRKRGRKGPIAVLAAVIAITFVYGWSHSSPDTSSGGSPVFSGPASLTGLVTNYGYGTAPASPISARITIQLDSSYRPNGFVAIDEPLGGSGVAEIASWADSILLMSISVTGDTIVWFGANSGGRYAGSYFIIGGQYARQGGRWWVAKNDAASRELQYREGRPDERVIDAVVKAIDPFRDFPLRTVLDTSP